MMLMTNRKAALSSALALVMAFKGINGVALNADGADGRRSEIAGSLFGHRALGLAVGTL